GEREQAIDDGPGVVDRRWRLLERQPVVTVADRGARDDAIVVGTAELKVCPSPERGQRSPSESGVAIVQQVAEQHSMQGGSPYRVRQHPGGMKVGSHSGQLSVGLLARLEIRDPLVDEGCAVEGG